MHPKLLTKVITLTHHPMGSTSEGRLMYDSEREKGKGVEGE
jgi:hypothetical protein